MTAEIFPQFIQLVTYHIRQCSLCFLVIVVNFAISIPGTCKVDDRRDRL